MPAGFKWPTLAEIAQRAFEMEEAERVIAARAALRRQFQDRAAAYRASKRKPL
jgi:hypothetical protein